MEGHVLDHWRHLVDGAHPPIDRLPADLKEPRGRFALRHEEITQDVLLPDSHGAVAVVAEFQVVSLAIVGKTNFAVAVEPTRLGGRSERGQLKVDIEFVTFQDVHRLVLVGDEQLEAWDREHVFGGHETAQARTNAAEVVVCVHVGRTHRLV